MLTLENVTKQVGGETHLSDISLTLETGSLNVLLGPTLSGKTSLIYSAFGLIDTHIAAALAHCLFNVPLAVWILEGFISGVPQGGRRSRLYRRLFLPEILR